MKLILAEVYFIGTDFDSDINFSYIMEDGNILHTTLFDIVTRAKTQKMWLWYHNLITNSRKNLISISSRKAADWTNDSAQCIEFYYAP